MNAFPDDPYDPGPARSNVVQGMAPPHSIEAEQGVLGAILLSDKTHYEYLVQTALQPHDFYRDRHRIVFETMFALYEENEPIDVLTVTEHMRSRGKLDEAGGQAEIDALAGAVPAVGNIRRYGRIVKEHSLLRRLLTTTYEIQASVHGHDAEAREIVERAETQILEVAHDDRAKDFKPVGEVLHHEIDVWQRLATEGISMTGTPSGFSDLDEMTGGFQPGNLIILAARPSMGKCLGSRTSVYDPYTGARRTIEDVVREIEHGGEAFVAALGPDLMLQAVRPTRAFRNGRRPIFKLRTRLGRTIEATANHPLLTIGGWKRLDELESGSRIAVPRRLPCIAPAQTMPDEELIRLATLIADDGLTNRTPVFTGARAKLSARGRQNPVTELCRGHGVWGRRSEHTSVPEAIFGLGEAEIKRFLSVLHGCAGYISAGERLAQVGYSTISHRLARDVQHLLLRSGIVAAIRTLERDADEGTDKTAYEVRITGQDDMRRFVDEIGACGRSTAGVKIFQYLRTRDAKTNDQLATSDVWWDEVVSIEPAGMDETFDIEVPELHNFVADDVIVHNSALVTNIAENVALHPSHPKAVALFSLEMSEGELAQRFIASQASIKGDDLRKGRLKKERDWQRVLEHAARYDAAKLFVDDSSDIGLLEIKAKARRLHQQHELGVIIVDYLQLMRADGRIENRVQQVSAMSRGLKILARELEVPVIALSQLSRGVESRTDKRPMLSDLRESGGIEQDADLVMFIYRDEYYYPETTETPGEGELIIAKHRNGGLGTVHLNFQGEYPRFLGKAPERD